jgi:hypothetical protein
MSEIVKNFYTPTEKICITRHKYTVNEIFFLEGLSKIKECDSFIDEYNYILDMYNIHKKVFIFFIIFLLVINIFFMSILNISFLFLFFILLINNRYRKDIIKTEKSFFIKVKKDCLIDYHK